mmetsp:Transcript_8275/g.13010  ORF Transcript_8275/g.13010 Transcript_8275/m.13010 type:complete len:215 (+) Transcript_8275:607-1251(+)
MRTHTRTHTWRGRGGGQEGGERGPDELSVSRHRSVVIAPGRRRRRVRRRHRVPLLLFGMRYVPIGEEHVGVRHGLPLGLRHLRLCLIVLQHPHEAFLPPRVHPRALAVPGPAVPAAPKAAQKPKHHVHHEVRQEQRQEQRCRRHHECHHEEDQNGAQDRVGETADEPLREVRHIGTPLGLPRRVRVRPRRVHLHLCGVEVVSRAQRRVGQGAMR